MKDYRSKIELERKKKREQAELVVRDATEADLPLIFSSWLKSFRNSTFVKYTDNTIYFEQHHKLIERLLKRSKVRVACSPTNPEDIFGYLVWEKMDGIFVLHYGYTKHTFRNLGVFAQLMKDTGETFETGGLFTHTTIACDRLMPKYELIYHPYILINYIGA